MAITRAQQVKQMLREGGRIGLRRGGIDRGFQAPSKDNPGQSPRGTTTASVGSTYDEAGLDVKKSGKDDDPYVGFQKTGIVDDEPIKPIKDDTTKDFRDKPFEPPTFPPGAALVTNVFKKPLQAGMTYDRNFFVDKVLKAGRIGITPLEFSKLSSNDQEKVFDDFTKLRNAGLTDAYGNLKTGVTITPDGQIIDNRDDSGPSETIKLIPDPIDSTDPTDPNQTTDVFSGIAPRIAGSIFDFDKLRREQEEEQFAADGGRIGAMEGGIMDLETGRQMYFLGKLVKKATRAVKKIVKSPIGKAAILGGALYFGGGAGGLKSFFGKGSFNPFLMSPDKGASFGFSGLGSILNKAGLVSKSGGLTLGGKFGLGTLALPFLMGDKQKQANLDEGPELTMEELLAIRNSPYRYMAPAFTGSKYEFADGGRIGYQEGSKEPVAKKTMPLLDMGGKEMDLRDDGGFVPIGRMEKADDVPARLSKNEFVFTADAVRNAGEGDVDKGAEVMYNMMKNLESGGEVSEESQGLEGARKMFQTSKRLEEVL